MRASDDRSKLAASMLVCMLACACRMHQDVGVNSMQRRWRDGSLELDLPAQALAEMFNCNHFLVGTGGGREAGMMHAVWLGVCVAKRLKHAS